MNMYAFYVVRGWTIDELMNLDSIEKSFLHHAQENYWYEEFKKYKALFGGDK